MKTILAPIDFSPASRPVVAEARALATALKGKIIFLSVVQPPAIVSDYGPLLENVVEFVAAGEKAVAQRLRKLRDSFAGGPIKVETQQATGYPRHVILDAAKKTKPDYIVIGSHGHSALYDLIVGSTTHGILKDATCPVVVVPAPAPAKSKRRATKR